MQEISKFQTTDAVLSNVILLTLRDTYRHSHVHAKLSEDNWFPVIFKQFHLFESWICLAEDSYQNSSL